MAGNYLKGATHCVNPLAMDEIFYRRKGDKLEYFAMGRGEWLPSDKPVEYLDQLHKLDTDKND